jgi:hypothetical protein
MLAGRQSSLSLSLSIPSLPPFFLSPSFSLSPSAEIQLHTSSSLHDTTSMLLRSSPIISSMTADARHGQSLGPSLSPAAMAAGHTGLSSIQATCQGGKYRKRRGETWRKCETRGRVGRQTH